MERALYDRFAEVEHKHWWFVAYRRIIAGVIASLGLPRDAKILDAGCGNGGNLAMLSQFGEVYASEMDGEAAKRSVDKRIAKAVKHEALPEQCSFDNNFFDLIVMLDVLEHIKDDGKALGVLRDKLKTGGKLLVAVPAYMFLWSGHDVANHHWRRYTRAGLRRVIASAGFVNGYASYFNVCLFPAAALGRFIKRIKGDGSHDLAMPAPWLNRALTSLFGNEALFIPKISFPFGVSLMAIATK
jgi:SAM-dependent methyltransferase